MTPETDQTKTPASGPTPIAAIYQTQTVRLRPMNGPTTSIVYRDLDIHQRALHFSSSLQPQAVTGLDSSHPTARLLQLRDCENSGKDSRPNPSLTLQLLSDPLQTIESHEWTNPCLLALCSTMAWPFFSPFYTFDLTIIDERPCTESDCIKRSLLFSTGTFFCCVARPLDSWRFAPFDLSAEMEAIELMIGSKLQAQLRAPPFFRLSHRFVWSKRKTSSGIPACLVSC